jgi:hypothetical protein
MHKINSVMTDGGRGIGDCASASREYAELRNLRFDSRSEAQDWVNRICADFGFEPITVKFTGRVTKRRRGTAIYNDRIIRLNKSGETAGTLLHEIAHFGSIGDHHGRIFKSVQSNILDKYGPELLERYGKTADLMELAENAIPEKYREPELDAEEIDLMILEAVESILESGVDEINVIGIIKVLRAVGVPKDKGQNTSLAWDLLSDSGVKVNLS